MKSRLALLASLTLSFPFALSPEVAAQGQATSARDALALVANQFGPKATQWIAEMHGSRGIPQPAEWDVLSFDERMPGLLYQFRAGMGRAGDMGPDGQRYPVNVPVGYFSPNQIRVDSVAAFTIAEGEARKAKMAFDSCDYMLRVREFSTDPLWRLELMDARRQIVGKIYISGGSGAVLRTVWMYRDQMGRPKIVDSAAPTGGGPSVTGITGTDFPEAAEPNDDTGIVRMRPPVSESPRRDTGIASIPAPPTPGGISSSPQPYRPVSPGGAVTDNSIPEPPPVSGTTAPPSNGTGGNGQMRDLREGPTATRRPDPGKPPIEIPSSSGGSTERIPPPPIPSGS